MELDDFCPATVLAHCAPTNCRWRCALEVIDELLSPRAGVRGEEMDALLELRWHLGQGVAAETVLRLFCDLRLRMEQRHYLPFFRIRRWLENHLVALVRTSPGAEVRALPVSLNFYCVEAIRRACLCAAGRQAPLESPRLTFGLRQRSTSGASPKAAVPAVR